MGHMDWSELMVAGVIALCVLGPICVVLLTQNLLDSRDDVAPEHFDFDAAKKNPGNAVPTTGAADETRAD